MNVFELFATLGLDTSGYDEGLDKSESKMSTFGSKLKSGLGTAAKIGGAAIGAVATATTALTAKVVSGTQDLAAYGDQIDKSSQKLGISAQAYQEWDAVMQHSGSSVEALKPAIKTLTAQVESGSEAFQQLGISQEEVASLSAEDLFSRVISGLQGMEEGTERTSLATDLLGKAAMELGPLLNTSAEDTQAMKDRVHELGGVLSDDAVKASAGFQDSLQDMQTAMSGMGRSLLSDFLPSITSVMDGLTDIFAGNDESGIGKLSAGVEEFANKIVKVIPRLVPIATRIVQTILKAIIDNLPLLIQAGMDIINELGKALIENLPTIFNIAIDVLQTLINGIVENLPMLIPAIIDIILQIVDTLIENIDLLVDGAIALIMGLADGLINALPILLEKAPIIIDKLITALIENAPKLLVAAVQLIVKLVEGIITNLPKILVAAGQIILALVKGILQGIGEVGKAIGQIAGAIWDGIKSLISKAIEWGKDLIKNFIGGIMGGIGKIGEAVGNIAGKIKGFLGFSEPDEGPLSDFHTYGPDLVKNFSGGIENNAGLIDESVKMIADRVYVVFQEMIEQASIAGQNIITALAQGLDEASGGLITALQKIQNAFSDTMAAILNSIKALGQNLAGAIQGLMSGILPANMIPDLSGAIAGVKLPISVATQRNTGANNENVLNSILEALSGIVVEVNIGGESIDGVITRSINRTNYRSGGR